MNIVAVLDDTYHFNLAFPYDPDLINAVKRLPGRTWNKRRKRWMVPASPAALDAIRAMAKQANLPLSINPADVATIEQERKANAQAAYIATTDKIPDAATLDFPHKTTPYQHQEAGLAFLATTKHGGLFWEMGLGKTKTAIDYAVWLDMQPGPHRVGGSKVLIVTPNTVVDNWGAEIEKHAGSGYEYDLLRAPMTLVQRATKVGTKMFSVVNTEVMSQGPLASRILEIDWDLVIIDESQRFKNPRAHRTKRMLKVQAKRRVILTGTPLTNSPQDLWAQLTFLRPGILGSWWSFQQEYLFKDRFGNVLGLRSGAEDKLTGKMASVGYRRTKSEVLDLPEKVYEDRHIEMSTEQARHYASMRDELQMTINDPGAGLHDSGPGTIVAHSILTQLLRLTQITAGLYGEGDDYMWDEKSPKLLELDEILNNDLGGKQVVVFGMYRRELEELGARYEGHPDGSAFHNGIIYGGVKPADRQLMINQFQDGQRRLLFVQAHSGGIGINLTAAQTAIYYTRGWSLEDYLQSQDRLHRIGQQGTVNIIHLVAKGTIDENIAKALADKSDLSRRITGDAARELAADVLRR